VTTWQHQVLLASSMLAIVSGRCLRLARRERIQIEYFEDPNLP